jgi:haloalkane dehalogenase
VTQLHCREAGDGPPVLLVHGYPESSYMWRHAIGRLAQDGYHAIAPDLAGFGDSLPARTGTWESHTESLARLHAERDLGPATLVVHDWGCLIGLRFACDHPEAIAALVISSGGFFPDGKWHATARTMRTPGAGEQLIDAFTQDGFAALMASFGITADATAEYWKAFVGEERRRAQLELYRSGDFEKLEPYRGRLAALGVPTLILWGAADRFAPPAGARRLHEEIPGSGLVILDDGGHFVWEEQPQRCAEELSRFLAAAVPR